MLKEHSFNTILESQQCCNELWCQRRKKGCLYGVQKDLCICRINGRVASFQLGSRESGTTNLVGVGDGTMRSLSIVYIVPAGRDCLKAIWDILIRPTRA
jgi:hypothetical protein